MKKIIHIINGLGSGGAENMLYKLLKYSDKNKYYHEVISLIDEGVLGEKIKAEGIKIHSLNLNAKNMINSLIKARKTCKEFDLVNTWLYHSDIFGFIVCRPLLRRKLIWNIRHSNLDKEVNKDSTLKVAKMNSFLSRYVDCITYNSNKAYENHITLGFADKNSKIIPNGFELDKFKFNEKSRAKIRKELKLDGEENVIITVGRWDIQKDYFTLLKALNELKNLNVNFKMLMVGTNLDYLNKELVDLINQYDLRKNLILLGRRNDIPELLSASDIYVSSSLGESFSNAIGEAMACELFCVVTDVGDSKIMVGDTGDVVMPKDYQSMASKIHGYLRNKSFKRNINARNKVFSTYDINSIIKSIEENFDETIKNNKKY